MAAPTPAVWKVQRRWMPRLRNETLWGRFRRRTRRARRRSSEFADVEPGCADLVGDGIAVAFFVIVLGLFLFLVGIPLLVALVDVALLVLLALGGLVARVVFRRPWLIEARDDEGTVLRWRVVGWRASRERVAEVRDVLAAGIVPPDAEVFADPQASPEP